MGREICSWVCATVVAVVGAGGTPAEAQPSLADLQAAAKHRNFDNQEARALVTQRELEARQAWLGLLPVLSAQGSYQRNQYEGIARLPSTQSGGAFNSFVMTARNQWDATLSARLPLIDASRWRAIRVGKLTVEAERAQVLATRTNVAITVAQTYYQLLGAEGVVLAAQRALKAAEENLDYAAKRHAAGSGSELDVFRAEAEVWAAHESISAAEHTRATLVRSLETLTGLSVRPPFRTPAADDLQDEGPLEQWISKAEGAPSVLVSAHQAKAAQATASQHWASLLPTVQVEALERFTNAPGFGESPYYSASATARWDLDLAGYSGARAASAAAAAARVRAARARAASRDEIHDAWHQVVAQIAKCRAARAQLRASNHAVAIASQEYEAGASVLLNLILAKRDAFSAEVTSLQADADLGAARATLHLLAGRDVEVEP